MPTSAKRKVLMATFQLGDRALPFIRRLEEAGLEVVRNPFNRTLTEAELIELLPGVFATFASVEPYTDRVFQGAPQLEVVARYGVGYDQIDVKAATRHGVLVAMTFGMNHEAVADSAFTLMAALIYRSVAMHQSVKEGLWGSNFRPGMWRMTVGIIGLGRIGKAMARRCKGFEMRVLAHDIRPDHAFIKAHGIELVPVEQLLRESDVVTLHIPHTPETTDYVNRERLALMKPGAYLVNTSRGGVVDEEALHEALTGRRIAGAALDVFKKEPPVGSPLLGLDNVLLSPHCAGANATSEVDSANRVVESILAVARGGAPEPEYLLNPEIVPTRRGTRR